MMRGDSVSTWTESVKARARHEGFERCGIAQAAAIDPEDRLGDWITQGHHADMDWMPDTQAVRQDVEKKLHGVQSVVVVARNYNAPRPAQPAGAGKVSRYAWGRDYHNALKKPLWRVARHIESLAPDVQTYCSLDTGPVMEKAWAARAGIGWIGKNSLLLNRELGSYVFLGVILTTLELRPDSPVPDQCGSCTLCIDACPTKAIVTPQVVDARRCISYHTIENRGEIPRALHENFNDWVFGCDICQDVCPWNRRAPVTALADFLPRPSQAHLDLAEVETMDEAAFQARFRGTPVLRAKRKGLQRNAAIVRRNQKES